MAHACEIIDDLSLERGSNPEGALSGAAWALISDRVMGGVSSGRLTREVVEGRPALRMQGTVSLENNGGFLQIARDLDEKGYAVDASCWTGVQLDVIGNGQTYSLHLRTTDLARPWESYRQTFTAHQVWGQIKLPFSDFVPHRTVTPLRPSRLRRIGLVAIGRAFEADIALGDIRFYGRI